MQPLELFFGQGPLGLVGLPRGALALPALNRLLQSLMKIHVDSCCLENEPRLRYLGPCVIRLQVVRP
jgi:hypothetical protein